MKLQFCFCANNPAGRYIPSHTHHALEIVYYTHGQGTSVIADHHYPVRAGDFAIIPAGVMHDQQDETVLVSICLGITESALEQYQGCWQDVTGEVGESCQRLYREIEGRKPAYPAISKGITWEIVGLIERQMAERGNHAAPDRVVDRALALIQLHDGQLSVGELANQLYVSSDYLRHLFHENDLKSPIQHLIDARIDKAKTLLTNLELPVQAVSEASGFESVFYFSRLFKKTTGLSPSQFRAAITGKDKEYPDSDIVPAIVTNR